MNYAALLAMLAALSFAAPFLTNLATAAGVPRALGIVTTLAGAIFLLGWLAVRERVQYDEQREARIAEAYQKSRAAPQDLASYMSGNQHLGDLLIEAGRPREALRVFEHYNKVLTRSALSEGTAAERAATASVIARLRQELAAEQEGDDASL